LIVPTAGGDTFVRDDVAAHSAHLSETFRTALRELARTVDVSAASDLFLSVTTHADRPVTRERQHLRNLGMEVVSLQPANPNAATVRLPQKLLKRLETRLDRYAGTAQHVGRSNFSALEEITPVSAAAKIEERLQQAEASPVGCLINLYSDTDQDS